MYTGILRIPTNRFCFRCNNRVFHSDVKGYPYVCHKCDENMYTFETYKKKGKDTYTYANPIAQAIQNRQIYKTVEQVCEGCGKHFLLNYCSDGTYDYVGEVCDCEANFHPIDGEPSISEWMESLK